MRYPALDGHDGWDNDGSSGPGARDATRDGSRSGTRGTPADNDGFTVQGKLYDPILEKPMVVSAETHGDFWEDDMDYSESVVTDGSETRADGRTEVDDKTCQGCPPEGKVAPMVRRCARWSEVTISYQTRICGTFYNPETQQIQEFTYCGVSFDGWKRMLCQFWEAKARYDQFFREDGTRKQWWKGYRSAINQARRHQMVATMNIPVKIQWFFMQPLSYKFFSTIFREMKDINVRYQP
ncbi:Tox-REase-5 domain-containing protein [Erwinia sp. B116]|nr:Tox-REase-5 domain-containing protein [Erwinia sp. B116]